MSWSLSFGSTGAGAGVPDLDESSVSGIASGGADLLDESYKTSRSGCPVDESYRTAASALGKSSSSRLSLIPNFDFGGLFHRNNKDARDEVLVDFADKDRRGGDKDEEEECPRRRRAPDAPALRQERPARRRPANELRAQRQRPLQRSSRSFISGVVFPESFDDVVTKGCLEWVRSSLKGSLKSLLDEEQRRRIELG